MNDQSGEPDGALLQYSPNTINRELGEPKTSRDTGFRAKEGDPLNLKVCPRGSWNQRMMVETVLSMLTLVNHFKKVMYREWQYFQMRLAYTMAAFNVLVQWHGLEPDENGMVHLSIAEFGL